jgi:hypothetical protein
VSRQRRPAGPRRHLASVHPSRALCGASIRWANITTRPELADCPVCIETRATLRRQLITLPNRPARPAGAP